MTVRIDFTDGSEGKFDRVTIKANGYAKCWYEVDDSERVDHYPPHMIEVVKGDRVSYQSPHGRV